VTLPTTGEGFESLIPPGRAASGYGERAWLLRALLAHVRPGRWTEWLQADPAGLVERAVRSEEARALLEGWIEATARFGDVAWATALLGSSDVRDKVTPNVQGVLEGLSVEDRAVLIAASADALEPALLVTLARSVPASWPRPLADAVLAKAAAAARDPLATQAFYDLVRAAALRLPPDRADDLADVASHNGDVRPGLVDSIDTIRLRARMHDAFAGVPPIQP
jgi:hypothetical protein